MRYSVFRLDVWKCTAAGENPMYKYLYANKVISWNIFLFRVRGRIQNIGDYTDY